jgi:hypothetical protein
MTRRRPSRLAIVGRPSAQSSLSLRSTPFGANGLDRASGPPRLGNYVMASSSCLHVRNRKEKSNVRPEIHAKHRSDDRARDAALSRVHHERPHHARRSGNGHAAYRATPRRLRHGSGTDCHERHTHSQSWASRSHRRDRTGLAAGAVSRRPTPIRTGRSGSRWPQHPSALALVPYQLASARGRTSNCLAVNQ